MSELKAYIVYTPREGVVEGLWKSYSIRIEGVEVYLKSEADKVIAEKDAEIAQLQAMLEERNKQVGELKSETAYFMSLQEGENARVYLKDDVDAVLAKKDKYEKALRLLVEHDLIKDCPYKVAVKNLVKEVKEA